LVNNNTQNPDVPNEHLDSKAKFQAQLDTIQLKFKESLPERFDELMQTWSKIKSQENNHDQVVLLHRLVHTITGSAGTFSYKELSAKAQALEILLKSLVEKQLNFSVEVSSQIERMLQDIVQTNLEAIHNKNHEIHENTPTATPNNKSALNKVLILEDDLELNAYLSTQLKYFGFDVQSSSCLTQLKDLYLSFQPDLIISDISFPESDLGGIQEIEKLIDQLSITVPIMFISAHQDIAYRLAAVRAQGVAYFSKPVNISALVQKVSEFTASIEPEPFRILVLDDDPSLVDLTIFTLQKAGMDAYGITDPLQILEVISTKKPDLILMDVHMPECSGIELAQVIRQTSSLSGIPIIFLSSDANKEVQFKAVVQGGDDFLTKPIDVNKLPILIESRAKRAREMNALMINDGLTGLYNHSYIKEIIDTELERSKRSGIETSVAMLDIDFFKKVNDTYGHMVGDQVLRSLSHFLLKRLRKTDKIGRYGGEEFIVILSDTPLNEALDVMKNILNSFREVVHHAEDVDFHVTFSCGVISTKITTDSNLLTQSMDQALYRAKRAGRNQVLLAELNPEEM